MLRTMFKSKIHRATVTQADLHYVGSVTIDADLLDAADLLPGELVHIVDITNGARLETYVIEGERGSGVIGINGAAAHLVHPGDLVILISYAQVEDAEARSLRPRVVHVDGDNRIVALGADPSELRAVAQRVAAGELSEVALDVGVHHSSVLASLADMQIALAQIVRGVRSSAETIAASSAQIDSGNTDLAQRTELQATRLQHSAATMAQLHGTVEQNAEHAHQATALAATSGIAATSCTGKPSRVDGWPAINDGCHR